ncbi:bifunctional tetrahydrofolate synthase/dihydrofolate synthase [Sodalis sp. CWE]|uniref:bifunctional tetrahydrofolate synthase/dihydrofolate synthase n=1 Tax=Sodalis sp. CWE TaxID=2803816 RepID=UPI001C7D2B6E|nr:bifunctional tetrahydrofolate synthase/dihydrofolate synthase [Sodalis sp. CWE]MBX4181084.1 bifunctional tetrahydrofolate synthase/dihydrofolate synthase [Sodalis sp. CWE]
MENISSKPQATSSLSSWLYYLEHLHDKPIDLGLDRVQCVASRLNLFHPARWIITVGGTNGKGTTCRLLEAILLANKMRVGLYSSPHLLRYTERVRIHGKELPESAHSEALMFIEAGRGAISLSYFEFGTLAALQLFRKAILDVVILEVGLGGRLDATNVVHADVAVITSIALDHTNWLGPDRNSIAKEKAGIFRHGKPAVIGEPDRPETLDKEIVSCGAKLYACNRDWWWRIDGHHWHWWDSFHNLTALTLPSIPLENAATALATVACLPFLTSELAVRQGLREAILPGRLQHFNLAPLTILDVAHNPHAASYLSKYLTTLSCTGKIRAVVGMLLDKDIPGTLICLREQVDVWYCASLKGPRSASAEQLAIFLDGNAKKFKSVKDAWRQAVKEAALNDCILVFGSFYTVSSVMND